MRKVFIHPNDLKSGMQIAEDIFNDYGAVVIPEGYTLEAHAIKKLKNLNIEKVRVFDHSQSTILESSAERFLQKYSANVDKMKIILHDISMGQSVDIQKINSISDSMMLKINENSDLISSMNQMRTADEYTYAHSLNVSLLCMMIGKWLKYDEKTIKDLMQAGLLHDIGKSMVASEILHKPERLTDEEYSEMKKHPIYGYRIIKSIEGIGDDVLRGVLMHHERQDGSGYPIGAKGEQIHLFARIIAVADIYDAMTSNRIYRTKGSPFEVFEYMQNDSFGVLDPHIITVFLNNIAAYYIGDRVKLNSGEIGEIVYINSRCISQPVIRIQDTFVDLTMNQSIKVEALL